MGIKWQRELLGNLVNFSQGLQVPVDKQFVIAEDGLSRFIRIIDFTNESEPKRFIVKPSDRYYVNESDIIMIRYGSQTAGKVVRGKSGYIANNMFKIEVISEDIERGFLYYLLGSRTIYNYLISSQSSSTMPAISFGMLKTIEIKYPAIEIQKKIAKYLDNLNNKIESNKQTNQTLEQMTQALFKSWFVDFDPVIDNALAAGNPIPDELQERAELRKSVIAQRATNPKLKPLPENIQQLFPNEFEESELGWIPKGWLIKPVDEAITINPRVSLPKGTVAPFADMKALPTDGYSINDVIKKAYAGGAKFQQGDVLLARITPCLENGKTGLVDFLAADEVGFGSTEFIVMRAKGSVGVSFVACLARYVNFRKHCIQSMVGSSGRQRVQNACFGSYFIHIPPNEEILNNFQKITVPMFSSMTLKNEETKSLTNLRDLLLPKLISGELKINKDVA